MKSRLPDDIGEIKMKIRTISAAYREIRIMDPNTAISEKQIRSLCHDGTIPYIKSGVRYLVNMDTLEEYFADKTRFRTIA